LAATAQAGNLFVAVEDERIVGTVMILDNPHTFWLLRFAVDPESAQATDAAKLLFDKMSAVAAQRGHHSVIVYTDSDDEQLNRRYEDLKCHKAGNYRCYWKEVR
ncbi:MAG TPA: GNAT family N-acetyltransferase, partial [Candidatus Saccharimonadales bacterium]|nr:GNAT family N-acetyltransferase [Candidatus Saccharimonadales bacterium]